MGYIHDVEDILQDRYSPLRLLGERYKEAVGGNGTIEAKQLRLIDGESGDGSVGLVPVAGEAVAEASIDDSVGDMFPDVREGVAVRALLKYEDLMLIRRIFVWYTRYNGGCNDAVRARGLMKRMLRKGGSEFYSKKSERR